MLFFHYHYTLFYRRAFSLMMLEMDFIFASPSRRQHAAASRHTSQLSLKIKFLIIYLFQALIRQQPRQSSFLPVMAR